MKTFFRRLFRLEPWIYPTWERHWLRVAFVLIVLSVSLYLEPRAGLHAPIPLGRLEHPAGIAQHINLEPLCQPQHFVTLRIVYWTAGLLWMLGLCVPLASLAMFIINVLVQSIIFSIGVRGHSAQLIGLMLMVQMIVAWWSVFRGPNRLQALLGFSPISTQESCLTLARIVGPAVYLCSTFSKMALTEGTCFGGGGGFVLAMKKTQAQAASDGSPVEGWAVSVGDFFAANPWVASWMLGAGFMAEFFSPLALLNRRIAALMAIVMISFHLANYVLMGLPFWTTQLVLLVFFINVPWWLWAWSNGQLKKEAKAI